MEKGLSKSFQIDGYIVYPSRNLIITPTGEQRVEPKIMEVLSVLADETGKVVSREEILNRVWTETYVSEEVVSRAISELRKAFGDDAKSSTIIETIPKKGYRLIADVQRNPTAGSPGKAAEKEFIKKNSVILAFVAFAVFITIAGSITIYVNSSDPEVNHQRIVPLTSYPGEEEDPVLSPDGSRLAFTWTDTSGTQNVYVKLLNSEQFLQLTDSRLYEFNPAWSPDGSRIAYVRFFDGLFSVPSLGGPEQKLTDIGRNSHPELDWSPDGDRIVFSDRASPSERYRLYVFDLTSHNKSLLTDPENAYQEDNFPRFSPDGSRVAFLRGTENSNDIYVLGIGNNRPHRITRDNLDVEGFDWSSDGRSIIFSSNRGGMYGLWKVIMDDNVIIPYSQGASNFTNPSIVKSLNNTVVFVKTEEDRNIWLIPIEDNARLKEFFISTRSDRSPQISPDGSRIAFVSHRSGTSEIWISNEKGQDLRKVTSLNGPYVSNPYWSPDGNMLLCDVRLEGISNIFSIDVEKEITHPLIVSGSSDMLPRYSKDGRSFYFTSNRTGSWELWKSDIVGNNLTQITTKGGYAAEEASDGILYYSKMAESGIWRKGRGDSTGVKILELSGINRANWSLTEDGIYFIDYKNTKAYLQFYSFTDSTVTELRKLDTEGVWYEAGLAAFPDGRGVLYTRLDREDRDIMRIVDN